MNTFEVLDRIKVLNNNIILLRKNLKWLKENSNERHSVRLEVQEQITATAKHRETLKSLLLPRNTKRLTAYILSTK